MYWFFIAFVMFIYAYLWRKHQYWKLKHIPYIEPTFFFGNSLPFLCGKENYHFMLKRLYDSMLDKPLVGCYEILNPVLIVRDPAIVIDVTIKNSSFFNARSPLWLVRENGKLNPLSSSLITYDDDRWKILRQRLTHVFSSNKSRKILLEAALSTADDMVTTLKSSEDSIDIQELCLRYMIDLIGHWIFGIKCHSFKQENSDFVTATVKSFNTNCKWRFLLNGIHPHLLDLFHMKDFDENGTNFFVNLIQSTLDYRKENNIKRDDYLDVLVDAISHHKETDAIAEEYSELDIYGNAFLVMAAGYDSTGMGLTFALYEIALNLEIQNKLRNEINTVTNQYSGKLDLALLNDLKYLDAVLLETTRKYPIDAALIRQCTEEYIVPTTTYRVDVGTTILIPIYGLHHDPNIYPDPQRFDPERFSPENKASIPKGAYVAFGEGQRMCIGMRASLVIMKVAIVQILSKFEVLSCDDTPKKISFVEDIFALKPKEIIKVNFNKL